MESFLLYIGKAALAAGAFYLLYLALFQHQKHFLFNRIYLPVSLALSFLIPLITFTSIQYIETTPASYDGFAYLGETTQQVIEPAFQFQWFHYAIGIYLLGILGFLAYLILGHAKAIAIVRKSRLQKLFNVKVNVTFRDVHPFSFFNKIVLSEKTLDNPNLPLIVQHEEIHVRGKHTLDILFSEILFLFQWFNPFAWLLKDAIKNNLEFLTDDELTQNNDAQQYQLAMVGLAHKQGVAPFLTAMNGSQLKNRIIMMKKKTENKYALIKQLVVLPLLGVLVMGLSNKEVKTEIVQAEKQLSIMVDGEFISNDDPAFAHLDFSKEFKGEEIINALKLNEEVVSNFLVIDESTESLKYFIKTTKYIPGKNAEFDKLTSEEDVPEVESFKAPKILYSVDNKIIETSEVKMLNKEYESATIFTGNDALEKYGEVARDASVIDLKTGEPKVKVHINNESEEFTVKGKITDLNGNPISGAAVLIDGTTVGTISDREGNYEIKLDDKNRTLIFVMLDYKKQEIEVKGRNEINVQLVGDDPDNLPEKLDEPVYKMVDQMPEFPGGDPALRKYIANSLMYPKIAMENGIQGKVSVTFVVNKLGKVVNPKISRGVDPSLDKEALRIVSSLPLWKPGKKDGKNVNVSYTVPINFELTVSHMKRSAKRGLDGKMMEIKSGETVSGKVTNEKGEPVTGAAVIIKGTTIGTITDSNGMFLLGLNDNNDFLIISKVGYEVSEALPNKEAAISVVLRTDSQAKSGQLKIKPTEKTKTTVRIRSTGDQSNEPIYVVDGKVQTNVDDLNPNGIESIDVLNGESATTVYGEKGKNGVILVTTKAMADLKKANPLLILDGEKTDKTIDDFDPDEIASMSVFKDAESIEKYGEEGKNGVIMITTKENQISSEMDLRKFFARNIKYPVLAQKNNQEGTAKVAIQVDEQGQVKKILEKLPENALPIGEVEVTAYKKDSADGAGLDHANKVFEKEVKRVISKLSVIDIPELKGKDVVFSVKFVLQQP